MSDYGDSSSWGKHSGREDGYKLEESKNKLEPTSTSWVHKDKTKTWTRSCLLPLTLMVWVSFRSWIPLLWSLIYTPGPEV